MTLLQYIQNYNPLINEILEKYIDIESKRISEILKNGSHIQIRHEKYNLERLASAKMLLEAQKFIAK